MTKLITTLLICCVCTSIIAQPIQTNPLSEMPQQVAKSASAATALKDSGITDATLRKAELLTELNEIEAALIYVPPILKAQLFDLKPGDFLATSHIKKWLSWLRDSRNSLGYTEFVNEPLVAGSIVKLQQHVYLGSSIMQGGGLLVPNHWLHNVVLQTTDPLASNYVSISILDTQEDRYSNGHVSEITWEVSAEAITGIFGSLIRDKNQPFFKVINGDLPAGSELLIEYKNFVLPLASSDSYVLPVFFRRNEHEGFFQISGDKLIIHGGKISEIEVIVPSYIQVDEEYDISVYLKDDNGNPIEGRTPSFDIIVDGTYFTRIEASNNTASPVAKYTILGKTFQQNGEHTIRVRSSGGGLSALSNPFIVSSNQKRIYWGDTQVHSSNGEGIKSLAAIQFQSDLDFILPTTHQRYLSRYDWQGTQGENAYRWDGDLEHGGGLQVITNEYWHHTLNQHSLNRHVSTDSIIIAMSDNPADDRYINSHLYKFVEIISNYSQYETYANRLLRSGHRLSFVASNHSHLQAVNTVRRPSLTAVIAAKSDSWESGLDNASTYVTSGARILLEVAVNGSGPGTRIAMSSKRIIKGHVKGTAGIRRIELVKNGKVIDTIDYGIFSSQETKAKPTDSLSSSEAHATKPNFNNLRVSFFSESAPLSNQRDLPRNAREWIGYLKSNNNNIASSTAPGFTNTLRQGIAYQNQRIDFITLTHGSTSSFTANLKNLTDDTVFELNLGAGHEDNDIKPKTRPSAAIKANRQMVSLFDLKKGPVSRRLNVDGYQDSILFELVNSDIPTIQTFEFKDSSHREGDYYYIRILQQDDQIAWSSPVFIGGFDQL